MCNNITAYEYGWKAVDHEGKEVRLIAVVAMSPDKMSEAIRKQILKRVEESVRRYNLRLPHDNHITDYEVIFGEPCRAIRTLEEIGPPPNIKETK